MASLDQLKRGDVASVVSIRGDQAASQRIMAMGLLPGASLQIVQVAPLGDPITIDSQGQRISLRRSEAACVDVKTN